MMACPACGGTSTEPRFAKPGGVYVRCVGCGLTRLDPLPTPAVAASLYSHDYFEAGAEGGYAGYDRAEAAHRRNAKAKLGLLSDDRPHPGHLVEIGSATGWLLAEAESAGWRATGIEVSDHARAIAAERTGATIHASVGEAHEQLGPGSVDAVVTVQVLEHLVDPAAALAAAAEWLRPGGQLLVETWDAGSRTARLFGSRWQQLTPPSVIWLFDRPSLTTMLEDAGFERITWSVTSKQVGLASVLELLASKSSRLSPILRLPLRSERVGRIVVPYRLGDLVTVTATMRGQ